MNSRWSSILIWPPQHGVSSDMGKRRSTRSRARARAVRPTLDSLELRVTPSTFLVTNALDPRGCACRGSLRWAVAQANLPRNQGATVAITSSVPGTITLLAGEIAVRSKMTIENESGHPITIQQRSASSRIFHVLNNPRTTAVTITGLSAAGTLTLTGGRVRNGNGGAILVDNPQNLLTLAYVNVVGNSASQVSQPAARLQGKRRRSLFNRHGDSRPCTVSGNSANGPNGASGHAGGVYTDRGVTLFASQVDSNTARNSARHLQRLRLGRRACRQHGQQ